MYSWGRPWSVCVVLVTHVDAVPRMRVLLFCVGCELTERTSGCDGYGNTRLGTGEVWLG